MWLLGTETIYYQVAFSHAGADPPNGRLEGGPGRPPELSLGHSLRSGIVPCRSWAPGLLRYSFQSPQVRETTGLSLGSPSLHRGLVTPRKKNGAIIGLISYVTSLSRITVVCIIQLVIVFVSVGQGLYHPCYSVSARVEL